MQPDILVVDDVALFREMSQLFLSRSGRVRTVRSTEEALAAIERHPPDILFADHGLPDGSGVELCRLLKDDAERRGIAFVLLGGGVDPGERAEAIRAGADDVLEKPLSRVDLIEAVTRLARPGVSRGLPRVPLQVPIRVQGAEEEHWGTVRNLSRGGLFVELARRLEGELALRFELPDGGARCSPRAQVVWRRESTGGRVATGAGLRFLEMEAEQVRRVADFVYEHVGPLAPAPATGELR